MFYANCARLIDKLLTLAEGGADRLAAGAGGRGANLDLIGAAVAIAVVVRATAHRAGNPLLVLGFVRFVAVHVHFSVPFHKKGLPIPNSGGKASAASLRF